LAAHLQKAIGFTHCSVSHNDSIVCSVAQPLVSDSLAFQ